MSNHQKNYARNDSGRKDSMRQEVAHQKMQAQHRNYQHRQPLALSQVDMRLHGFNPVIGLTARTKCKVLTPTAPLSTGFKPAR
jgi:hypothetical protein